MRASTHFAKPGEYARRIFPAYQAGSTGPVVLAVLALGALVVFFALLLTADTDKMAVTVLAASLTVPAIYMVWKRPEFGLLALIFVACSFIPLTIIDVRLFVGGLNMRDLMFIGALVILAVRVALKEKIVIPWWPVSAPLLVFMGVGVFSALFALFYEHVEPTWALGELRPFLYYGVLFATAWAIRRREQLVVLLVGLFIMADLVAAVLILQQLFGTSQPLLAAMANGGWLVWQADDPTLGFGVVRVIPPAHVLIYIMSVVALCHMLVARQPLRIRLLLVFEYLYINLALLFTYTRAQWVASAIALILCLLIIPWADKAVFLRYLAGTGVLGLMVYATFGASLGQIINNAPFVNSIVNRANSVLTPDDTLASYSLQWRIFETGEAMRSISEHPLLGVGLGNVYRDVTLLSGEAQRTFRGVTDRGYLRLARFVHNGYLFLAVKTGIPGLICFAIFAMSFLVSSWRTYLKARDRHLRSLTLAVILSFIGVLAWSITEPHILRIESTTAIGLMMGVVASITRMEGLQA